MSVSVSEYCFFPRNSSSPVWGLMEFVKKSDHVEQFFDGQLLAQIGVGGIERFAQDYPIVKGLFSDVDPLPAVVEPEPEQTPVQPADSFAEKVKGLFHL